MFMDTCHKILESNIFDNTILIGFIIGFFCFICYFAVTHSIKTFFIGIILWAVITIIISIITFIALFIYILSGAFFFIACIIFGILFIVIK